MTFLGLVLEIIRYDAQTLEIDPLLTMNCENYALIGTDRYDKVKIHSILDVFYCCGSNNLYLTILIEQNKNNRNFSVNRLGFNVA